MRTGAAFNLDELSDDLPTSAAFCASRPRPLLPCLSVETRDSSSQAFRYVLAPGDHFGITNERLLKVGWLKPRSEH